MVAKAKEREKRLDAEFAARLASLDDEDDSVALQLPRNRTNQ